MSGWSTSGPRWSTRTWAATSTGSASGWSCPVSTTGTTRSIPKGWTRTSPSISPSSTGCSAPTTCPTASGRAATACPSGCPTATSRSSAIRSCAGRCRASRRNRSLIDLVHYYSNTLNPNSGGVWEVAMRSGWLMFVAVVLVLALAAVLMAGPASAQSFVGNWRASAQAPDGVISETLKVEKTADGYAITASEPSVPPPEGMVVGPAVEIALEGDSFSFKRVIKSPQGDLEIIYKGTVSGDTF